MPTIHVRHLLDPERRGGAPGVLHERFVCGLKPGGPFLVTEREDDEFHPVTCRACLRGLEARRRRARKAPRPTPSPPPGAIHELDGEELPIPQFGRGDLP
jgi:hypothetical protein